MSSNALQERCPPSRLRLARHQLMNDGCLQNDIIEPALERSWLRSWAAGLPPCGRVQGAPHASMAQLSRARERQQELLAHARPVMEFVFDQTRDSDSMVILAGTDGMLLHAFGDASFVSRAERVALRPGATWHEQYRGTNAIGTALTDGQAVVIHGAEHYLERNGFLTCTAAPIHDPTGQILGVLDVSGDHRSYHRHTLGLVRSATRMIEHRLFETRHPRQQSTGLRLHFHVDREGIDTVAEGLLALREDGQLLGANAAALACLGLGWADLPRLHITQLFNESVEQLLDWGRRSNSLPRVVHTQSKLALWVSVETGRATSHTPTAAIEQIAEVPCHRSLASVPASPCDALAALDTGDAVVAAAIKRARKVMAKPIALLLQGESGAGKEVFARAVHASGPRRNHAFVAVNCAAIPEHLIEAELFGYQSGAFTGARREGAPGRIREAHGGTLFLDEIGDMPLPLQTSLLRVLQDRQVVPLGGGKAVDVDFSLICATHRNLGAAIQAGKFREDLYYRINGLGLQMPALRERSDLPLLIERELRQQLGNRNIGLTSSVMDAFRRYAWPGNLRQLSNALRTACALLDDEVIIDWEHLPDDLSAGLRACLGQAPLAAQPSIGEAAQPDLRSLARLTIEQTLQACAGNMSETARRLGISRNTLYRKLRA